MITSFFGKHLPSSRISCGAILEKLCSTTITKFGRTDCLSQHPLIEESTWHVSRVLPTTETNFKHDACLLQEPDYLESIDELIACKWEGNKTFHDNIDAAQASVDDTEAQTGEQFRLGFTSRDKSRLLVCHDFKGGYTEDPFERGYSFEFWQLVDTFIYFSHKRITLPPRGWVDAGHRHGSKVLGTVIFEWAESKPDLEKCLYGSMSQGHTSDANHDAGNLSFSTVCASQLIKLAKHRNFDGYLINVETDLNFLSSASCYPRKSQEERCEDAASMEREKNLAGLEALISSDVQQRRKRRMERNATVLASWVGWLKEEGKRLVGPHWDVIWYDSVTTAGRLRWQDALTSANAPFFKLSDAIFTNYTWARPPDPAPPGRLPDVPLPPLEHHPLLLMSAYMAKSMGRSTVDVYMGIDVFGRNCYGGYEVGRPLNLIFPSHSRRYNTNLGQQPLTVSPDPLDGRDDLGLSVALFAPGWTWEREVPDGGERSWLEWWEDDLQFWFGCQDTITTTEFPGGGSSGVVKAVSSYFGPRARHLVSSSSSSQPPPSSSDGGAGGPRAVSTPFYTNFCRGSGYSWWVCGRKVYDASSPPHDPLGRLGWTDIGCCFPKPDRIWPRVVSLHLDDESRAENTMRARGAVRTLRRVSGKGLLVDRADLIDCEAWQGGSSLEVVLRPLQDINPDAPTPTHEHPLSSMTILPLCTLNAYHVAPLFQGLPILLEMVVKLYPDAVGSRDLRDSLRLQPYLIWASDEPNEECTYHLPLPLSSATNLYGLSNGWYSAKTTLHLDDINAIQLGSNGAVVPVIALGIHASQGLKCEDTLRILVGEVRLSALPPLSPITPTPLLPSADTATSARSSGGTVHWNRVSAPSPASSTSLWGVLTWGDEDRTQSSDLRGGKDSLTVLSGYSNIFASVSRLGTAPDSEQENEPSHIWLGTSTYEHNANSFVVAGLELLDLVPKGSDKLIGEQTSITFSVTRVGASEMAVNGSTEGEEFLYGAERKLELEVSLI